MPTDTPPLLQSLEQAQLGPELSYRQYVKVTDVPICEGQELNTFFQCHWCASSTWLSIIPCYVEARGDPIDGQLNATLGWTNFCYELLLNICFSFLRHPKVPFLEDCKPEKNEIEKYHQHPQRKCKHQITADFLCLLWGSVGGIHLSHQFLDLSYKKSIFLLQMFKYFIWIHLICFDVCGMHFFCIFLNFSIFD